MIRSSGVFLNISSLPGEYGIGGFSLDAKNFAEFISSMGFHWWQTLPITTIGKGNSPYSGISAFAGNYLYIDPYSLEKGLLTEEELISSKYHGSIYLTDYEFAKHCKKELLKKAFSRISDTVLNNIKSFRKRNQYWLEDYALYMALYDENNYSPWSKWSNNLKFRNPQAILNAQKRLEKQILFYCFEQYEFFRQWRQLKFFINNFGVGVLGDIPMYVHYDSVDVWANPHLFQLDKDLLPTAVAGVPPDYFNADGQLWGNPLYDYAVMKKDNYHWLIKRIIHNLELYDMLRVDHFRGFHKYWSIPAESTTAKNGKWVDGPKMELWNNLKKIVPNPKIIAEDLGLMDEQTHSYVKESGFCGMRVMQFAFDGDSTNIHLPHNYDKNCVGYTCTHDNDTTLGWLLSLNNNATREYALNYANCSASAGWASGGGNCSATKSFIRTLLASSCDLAIVPLQDLCGYGSDTRMNTPGVAEGNWVYRTNYTAMDNVDSGYMRSLNNIYGRTNPFGIC